MGNQELLKIIKKGSETWNVWRQENPHVTVDLSGADLGDANLLRANLTEADLRNATLTRTDLRGARLSRATLLDANLYGAALLGANLKNADLSSANLSNAILDGADLSGACLRRAMLVRADLKGANLRRVDLSEANLSRAGLRDVNLVQANLREADFSHARLENTTLNHIDLSTVKGLGTVDHRGPSTIGVDTLYQSQGKIPEVFLRGIGLPEGFLTYLPSLISQPIEFYSCFISYSHADQSFARRLHDALQGRGIRCWLDEHQLLPGDKIYTEVDRGIRIWDKVLLCCSKDALTSWWVDNEIKIAFDKEQQLWRDRKKEVLALIPLNLDNYLFSGRWESGLATEVKARLAANFGGWEQDNKKFDDQFERLVKALRTDSRGKEPLPPALL